MQYEFVCENFECQWNKVVLLPASGGVCTECGRQMAMRLDTTPMRAAIAQAEALEDIAHNLRYYVEAAQRQAEALERLANCSTANGKGVYSFDVHVVGSGGS